MQNPRRPDRLELGTLKAVLISGILGGSAASSRAGVAGNALHFSGDDSVKVPHSGDFDNLSAATVEFWVRYDNPNNGGYILDQLGPAPGNPGEWGIITRGTRVQFYYRNLSGINEVDGYRPVTDGNWHHVAVAKEGRSVEIYCDGERDTAGYISSYNILNGQLPIYLGSRGNFEQYFEGDLDEVRIWDYKRSAAEISQSWNRLVAPDTPGLRACWRFDEAVDDQNVFDASPRGNHGTLGETNASGADDPTRAPSTAPIVTIPTWTSTAFTYQGRLTQAGLPANGVFDLRFALYDDPDQGSLVGSLVEIPQQPVSHGLFTVKLDFGSVFTGRALWLEVQVRSGGGEYAPVLPRNELTPTPHAVYAQTAGSVPGGITGGGTVGRVPMFVGPDGIGDSAIQQSGVNIGIGTTSPESLLTVAGTIESTAGGFKFPDGSTQTTAASNGGGSGGPWNVVGNDIFYTAGSVGIGTAGPFPTRGDVCVVKSATLPTARHSVGIASDSLTGKIYSFGGNDSSGVLSQIVEYDPVNDTVAVKSATLPTPRCNLAAAANPLTGKIYCFGGRNGSSFFHEIVEYDPTNDTVVVKSAMLPTATCRLAAVADRNTGRILCIGGLSASGNVSQIVEYDPASDSIAVKVATLPTGRRNLAAVADAATGRIVCFGGQNSDGDLDQIVEYDPASDSVAVKAATLPTGRGALAAAADPDTRKIYCFGGDDDRNYLNQIVEYDPASDSVAVRPAALPTGRAELAAAAHPVTGQIYCFGGSDGNYLAQVVEFTPPAQTLFQVGDPGDGTGAVSNSWSVFSSRTFKRDITPLNPMDYQAILGKVNATDVVRYRYAKDARQTPRLGVIAEDSPSEILSPGGQAVSLPDYNAFLLAAIKAQQAVLDEKERQLTDLKARVEKLEALVNPAAAPRKEGAP